MAKDFFEINENYNEIIENALNKENNDIVIEKIEFIPTGWTNIVYEVFTTKGNYFFRFPRDQFWERTIVKDSQFSQFIKNKTSFRTVDLKLKYDNGRPFSVHKKIEGIPLAKKMNDLDQKDVNKISKQIAKFMYEMHNLNFNRDEVFSINNIGLDLQDFISELLNLHVSEKDREFWNNNNFVNTEKNYCLIHGDLNSSNILLDNNNNISAIIDFGFGGYGNKYFDISRIIGRCPESFKYEIINSYETLENEKIDKEKLEKNIKIWSNIDNGYINYMRKAGICNL